MFKKICLFIFFFIAALLFACFLFSWFGKRELVQQRQTYLAAGGILDADIFTTAEIPDAINAAIAYDAVWVWNTTLTNDERPLLYNEPALDDPAVAALLTRAAPTLAALQAAADLPDCRWATKYDSGSAYQFQQHLYESWWVAGLLELKIRQAAASADKARGLQQARDDQIIRDLETFLKFGLHLSKDSTTYGQDTATRTIDQALKLYEEFFGDHAAPMHDFDLLLAEFDERQLLNGALQGNTLGFKTEWEDLQAGYFGWFGIPRQLAPLFNWDRAYYYQMAASALDSTEQPYFEAAPIPGAPWYAYTTGWYQANFDNTAYGLASTALRIEMLNTAETLRTYKNEYGSYPAPEAEIVELPIDPTTGKRIEYALVGDGFVLTGSVGVIGQEKVSWTWEK